MELKWTNNVNVTTLGLIAVLLFGCFGGFVFEGTAIEVPRWARAAVPTIAVLVGLVFRDAYFGTGRPTVRTVTIDVAVAILCVMPSQSYA